MCIHSFGTENFINNPSDAQFQTKRETSQINTMERSSRTHSPWFSTPLKQYQWMMAKPWNAIGVWGTARLIFPLNDYHEISCIPQQTQQCTWRTTLLFSGTGSVLMDFVHAVSTTDSSSAAFRVYWFMTLTSLPVLLFPLISLYSKNSAFGLFSHVTVLLSYYSKCSHKLIFSRQSNCD